MAARQTNTTRSSRISRRTGIVWASFLVAMTLVTGLLALGGSGASAGFLAASTTVIGVVPPSQDPVFDIDAELDEQRWQAIVIHHLGRPAGDAKSVDRLHQSYGLKGLGYHFLIGNGNGMDDGVVHMGNRWMKQLPGAHVVGADGDWFNHHAIGICLIGNGDRRPFTRKQIDQTMGLLRRLQQRLGIPADRVYLHRDVAEGLTTSPGRFFPVADLQRALEN